MLSMNSLIKKKKPMSRDWFSQETGKMIFPIYNVSSPAVLGLNHPWIKVQGGSRERISKKDGSIPGPTIHHPRAERCQGDGVGAKSRAQAQPNPASLSLLVFVHLKPST